jgi:multidrug efflux pump subunit AcrA (membrane-fusion protein)
MGRFALYSGTACVALLLLLAAGSPLTRAAPGGRRSGAAPEPAGIVIGDCRVRLLNEVQLSSARTGILEVAVTEGETVKTGSVVAQLRDRLQRVGHAIAQREAGNDVDVRFARKASELAQAKFLRAVDANKSAAGTVSELELRELRLAAEKSLLQIEQAEHQFLIAGLKRDEAEENVNLFQVVAPFDGTVLDVYKRQGEVVREGEQIVRLAAATRVRVEGYVAVEQAVRIRRGCAVQARLQFDDKSQALSLEAYPGRIVFVDIKVEPVSRKVKVLAEVANPDGLLRDGLEATLTVATPAAVETSRKD